MGMICTACPRNCGTDRTEGKGFCGKGETFCISRAAPHYWEEPPLSGTKGSGTVFFTGCSLGCVFCQNYKISRRSSEGRELSSEELKETVLSLQAQGVHNLNLVTPTHYSEQLVPFLEQLRPSLNIPVVWNSSGYEKVETLRKLEGLVDIWLPDLKFFSPEVSERYCGAKDYFDYASAAVSEMLRQQPVNVYGEEGLLKKGVILRHLILPAHTLDSIRLLRYMAEHYPRDLQISLMCQYIPEGRAADFPEINRRLKRKEYARVVEEAWELGFENAFTQDFASADESFIPEFSGKEPSI